MAKKRHKRTRRSDNPPSPRAEVLYDGDCAMCSNLALRIDGTDANDALTTTDLRRATLPDDVTADQVRHELHVLDADGPA